MPNYMHFESEVHPSWRTTPPLPPRDLDNEHSLFYGDEDGGAIQVFYPETCYLRIYAWHYNFTHFSHAQHNQVSFQYRTQERIRQYAVDERSGIVMPLSPNAPRNTPTIFWKKLLASKNTPFSFGEYKEENQEMPPVPRVHVFEFFIKEDKNKIGFVSLPFCYHTKEEFWDCALICDIDIKTRFYFGQQNDTPYCFKFFMNNGGAGELLFSGLMSPKLQETLFLEFSWFMEQFKTGALHEEYDTPPTADNDDKPDSLF